MIGILIALLGGVAHADDIQPGLTLPGASSVDTESMQVGAGIECTSEVGCGPVIEGQANLTPELGLIGELPVIFEDGEANPEGLIGARYLVVDTDAVRLAPFVAAGAHSTLSGDDTRGFGAAVGAAAEVGSDELHLDAALPVYARIDLDGDNDRLDPDRDAEDVVVDAFEAAEIGVSVSPHDDHSFRVGFDQQMPTAGYRFDDEGIYAELEGGYSLDDENVMGRLSGGVTF